MYPHSFLWHYLWIAPHALQFIIVIVMIRRKLVREFPLFFAYSAFEAVEQSSLFVLDHIPAVSDYQYWYIHLAGSLVGIALRFGVIREIFVAVFRNYPGLKQLTRVIFRWASIILVFAAIVVAARAPEIGRLLLFSRVHILDLFVEVIQGGLWLVLLGLSAYFGLSWKSFPYGIAFGMGIFLTVDIATEAMRIWTGFVAGYVFDFVSMATYHCCVILWLVYLSAPESSPLTVKKLPKHNVEEWNAELQRLLLQ
ncbi:MAG: hypothetical protein ACRD3H_13680 [Terriglobales bacterium]|jgi:hypothetical protein|nr:hypothetical protein [Terriglobales bacterium]